MSTLSRGECAASSRWCDNENRIFVYFFFGGGHRGGEHLQVIPYTIQPYAKPNMWAITWA